MPDPRLKTYAPQAVRHLAAAGHVLAERQETGTARRGNVPAWPGSDDVDFHGTLAAVWIWARHQRLSGATRYQGPRNQAWGFVDTNAKQFIPDAIDSAAGDETAYDCAMVLVAAAAERALGTLEGKKQAVAERAARVLANHLGALEKLSGREFSDPGFLAFALADYARAIDDRGLLAGARKFVDRAFGMKMPTTFEGEPGAMGGLFDFSSTTATRLLAVVAAEGATPFVGAWLRERVAASVPRGFTPRRLDENTWNACAAWALGRAYVVSTDPVFMQAYSDTMDELERRDADRDGALGRDQIVKAAETAPTFYYSLAIDALVTPESAAAAQAEVGVRGGR
ncbi:MAG TPA: hypothetical protein VIF57_08330 [Polyangia bacterium]|jgi:hypothetical protein